MVEFADMKTLFVHVSRLAMNWLYRIHCTGNTRGNTVVFLSRQADEPSYDFIELAREFSAAGWDVHMHLKKVKTIRMLAYVGHVLKECKLLAQARLVILDRYDPVISLLDFDLEPSATSTDQVPDTHGQASALHAEFPAEPVVVQLWHAFGAYKKFGYQSVGTREGHLQRTVDTFNIHRNYSWIMCSGQGCRAAFAEAFAYPIERVIAYSRPEFFELRALGGTSGSDPTTSDPTTSPTLRILMAPTRRMNKASTHPFRNLHQQRDRFLEMLTKSGIEASVEWMFHPLDADLPAPGNASEALLAADIVVTDYSSIVYEAYLLGKPALFYIPDIDEYRESPGLNSDPDTICPRLCARDAEQLVHLIEQCAKGNISTSELDTFVQPAFDFGEKGLAGIAPHSLLDVIAL